MNATSSKTAQFSLTFSSCFRPFGTYGYMVPQAQPTIKDFIQLQIMQSFFFILILALCLPSTLTVVSMHCPTGQSLVPGNYKPTTNGCGSSQWQALAGQYLLPYNAKFKSCCDSHDICFGTCGAPDLPASFQKCNLNLFSCMDAQCQTLKNFFSVNVCKGTAAMIFNAVKKAGEGPYSSSQKKACKCQ